ncbi:MAG: hypothetical protein HY868_19670 [Chloroflexi bacterium]|nr:hypothetical protein [Chloroflexota bacterium]
MNLKHWGGRLLLGCILVLAALACQSADILVTQLQPTATPTRTVRPTFTPIPPTATLVPPSPTPPPTIAPTPTRTPTRRPTARPPTAVPPPPVVVQPTAVVSKMPYAANPASCTHSGGQYIKGKVYDSSDPSAYGVSGLKVALGGGGGTDPWIVINNFDDGVYSFTLAGDAGPYKPAGTYYVWVMDSNGNRISDVGGPININPLPPDAAGTCWAGSVDFWRR